MKEEINLSEWTHLLAVLHDPSGSLSALSKEMLGKGRELADQLGVWLMVYSIHPLSDQGKEIISYGGDQVFEADSKDLMERTESLSMIIEQRRPEVVLFSSSLEMVPLASRVAQRFRTGLVTDCVALNLDLTERRVVATRPLYDGRLLEELYWPTRRPQMVAVKPGAFPEGFPDPRREGTIEKIR